MSFYSSFLENEIVTPGTILHIVTNRNLKAKLEHHDIGILQADKQPKDYITIRENKFHISTADLASGIYRLRIGSLIDTNSQSLNEYPFIKSFLVQEVRGHVSNDFRILHMVRLAIGQLSSTRLKAGQELPAGTKYLEILRVAHRQTNATRQIAFDTHGKEVDADKILSDLDKRRFNKFGHINQRLWKELENADSEELFEISIWPIFDHPYTDYDKTNIAQLSSNEVPRHISAFQRPKEEIMDICDTLEADVQEESHLPYVMTKLTKKQILEFSKHKDVATIFLIDKHMVPCGGVQSQLEINRGDRAQALSYKGTGVRVAIHETGIVDPKYASSLQYVGPYTTTPDGLADVQKVAPNHIVATSSIIKNISKKYSHGFSPDCTLHLANEWSQAALKWAVVDKTCSIISMSWMGAGQHTKTPYQDGWQDVGTFSQWDAEVDWYATTPPFPLIVMAAGNVQPDDTSAFFVGFKAYNGLIVGSHTPDGSHIASTSLWKNPDASTQSSHHDRELPDISANGDNIDTLDMSGIDGTSFAAPVVAGVSALLQGIQGLLKITPEACRAIIFASAGRRVKDYAGHTWSNDRGAGTDSKDGVGMVDAEAAVKIARNQVRPDDPIRTGGGWDARQLDPKQLDDIGRTKYSYKVRTPANQNMTFRATLAWNSMVTSSSGGTPQNMKLSTNLNLWVFNTTTKQPAGYSATFDNSYEIVEFQAQPNTVYEILIEQVTKPPRPEWYGVAWQIFIKGQSV
jgi:Subtilase family